MRDPSPARFLTTHRSSGDKTQKSLWNKCVTKPTIGQSVLEPLSCFCYDRMFVCVCRRYQAFLSNRVLSGLEPEASFRSFETVKVSRGDCLVMSLTRIVVTTRCG